MRAHPVLALASLVVLSACGSAPETSAPQQRQEVPPLHVTDEAAQAFIDHFDAILASPGASGSIGVDAFLSIMPMEDDQRSIITRAFPTPFTVTCDATGLCDARTTGRPAEAVMDITLNGISDPKLKLDREVVTGMVRRADGIEFCNVEGMWAKKFFVTRVVQGILLTLDAGGPGLVVNVDDDEQNFTCL